MDKKKTYIEILRIIAIIFVVFNHTIGFTLYSYLPIGSGKYWISTFVSAFVKCAVPIFLMISGGLLIAKEESIKSTYKRVGRIILILLIVSVILYIHNGMLYKTDMSFKDFISKLYMGKIDGILWYLYLYVGYLISLPLLRKFTKLLTNKEYIYMFVIAFVFSSAIPAVEFFFLNGNIAIQNNIKVTWIASDMVLYPIVGYYIENKLDIERFKSKIPVMWLVNMICLVITCILTYKSMLIYGNSGMQMFLSSFVLINASTLYITIKVLLQNVKINEKIQKFVHTIGACTFGVYLFHIPIRDAKFVLLIAENMVQSGMNGLLVYIIITLLIVIITTIIVWVLKKIPGLKKLL